MKNAIFISSGIGNALMLVPLIKALKKQGKLVAICTSPFEAEKIFDGFEDDLFDDRIIIHNSIDWIKQPFSFKRRFDNVYLDHFAARRANIVLAHSNANAVVTNTVPHRLPGLFERKLRIVEPIAGIHEGTQYMKYIDPDFSDKDLNSDHFKLKASEKLVMTHEEYITIQPGSGNNITPWKTYPLKSWVKVIEEVLESHPNKQVVVLGDHSEISLKPHLPKNQRVIDAIGMTELIDLPGILSNASLHIGNDSSLMHIAGCVGTPTLTVWGGSDPEHYGWHKIDPTKHKVIHHNLDCGPCSRWIEPNMSKVEVPSMCPDFLCLKKIKTEHILQEVSSILTD